MRKAFQRIFTDVDERISQCVLHISQNCSNKWSEVLRMQAIASPSRQGNVEHLEPKVVKQNT
jgi:hypothetical protein